MTVSAATPPIISAEPLFQLAMGFRSAKTVLSAVELGVFGVLAAGALDGTELAGRVGLHPRGARDFLDALVALGLLDRDGTVYRNTPATDALLDPAKPAYVGGFFAMASARLYPCWGELTAALRTGQPQDRHARTDGGLFAGMYQDPATLRQFLRAMTGLSLGAAAALADRFPWTRYGTVVDVGAADGCVPVQLARRHPHLTGGGFDLPPVGRYFAAYVAAAGFADRLRFYPGDFFTDPLPAADVLVFGHILHDWGMAEKLALLDAAYRALPGGGAIVVYDAMIDDERRHHAAGLLASLNMLLGTDRGSGYTGAQCRQWLQHAGFRTSYLDHLAGPHSMAVGIK